MFNRRHSFLVYFACAVLFGLTSPTRSWAKEWLGLTGLELAEEGAAYAFVGTVAPLDPQADFGQGWVQRYWLDWVKYQFESNGETVRAKAPGFSASLGYQQSGHGGFWAAYVGAGYRNTNLVPDRPDADVRGSQSALLLLGELDRHFAQIWRFTGAIQYSAGPDSYWSRAKFLKQSSAGFLWQGVEVVFQGDPDYRTYKLGVVLDEYPAGKGVSLNFKIGATKTKGLKAGGYAGLELVGFFGRK